MSQRRIKPRYRFRLTRLGFHFLFIALFAIIGGSLRGFNLLLLLAGILIGAVIVQWRQGRLTIQHARVRRRLPRRVFAGTPFSIRYDVRNGARTLPIWSIHIEDSLRKAFEDVAGSEAYRYPPAIVDVDAGIGCVEAGHTASTWVRCRIQSRGRYLLGPVAASTTFPFSLMKCDSLQPESLDELFVFPQLFGLRGQWQELLRPDRGQDGSRSVGRSDLEGEFFGLRPWQSGDFFKHIHWRTFARIGEPAVRQFERRVRHEVDIIVDGCDIQDRHIPGDPFETCVRLVATLLDRIANENRSVRLAVLDGSPEDDWIEGKKGNIDDAMRRLACAKPVHHDESSAAAVAVRCGAKLATLLQDRKHGRNRRDILIASSRSRAAMLSSLTTLSSQDDQSFSELSSLRRLTAQLHWLDVRSEQVRRRIQSQDLPGSTPLAPPLESQDV